MSELRYSLLTDGSSDRVLLRIIDWLLRHHVSAGLAVQGEWADLRQLHNPPRNLADRIEQAVYLYPCDVLFIHRDAEAAPREHRAREIEEAKANSSQGNLPSICVVPVRMTEAWLLFDEQAIRKAAGNLNGSAPLSVPAYGAEGVPNPKELLHELLLTASELTGRRRKRFRPERCVWNVAQYISDFTPLRSLSAFRAMEQDVAQLLNCQGWGK